MIKSLFSALSKRICAAFSVKRKMSPEEYFEKAKFMWHGYVPVLGQAETVQGELIRAVEKLRNEAQRNGNGNWDHGHEILANYLETTLKNSRIFTKMEIRQIESDIYRLLRYDDPYLKDEIYDRLTARVVDWYMKNQKPIPHTFNPNLHR